MPNRNLTPEELVLANRVLADVRTLLLSASSGDTELHWALRRKVAKELGYDERGKPMHRKMLKLKKAADQRGLCAICTNPLPEKSAVLDRMEAMLGYTLENTRLICPECDTRVQAGRGYH